MAFSGVRSSWLMVARNRDLARFASSARRRASSEMTRAVSSSEISSSFSAWCFKRSTALRRRCSAAAAKKTTPQMSIVCMVLTTGFPPVAIWNTSTAIIGKKATRTAPRTAAATMAVSAMARNRTENWNSSKRIGPHVPQEIAAK